MPSMLFACGLYGIACPITIAQCGEWQYLGEGPGKGTDVPAIYDTWNQRTIVANATIPPPGVFDTWTWNGAAWTMLSSSGPSNRGNFPLAFDSARGVTILHGGEGSFPWPDTWEFDGVKWKEIEFGSIGARAYHTLAYDSKRDRTTMFGGVAHEDQSSTYYDDTFEWNGNTKKWQPFTPVPRPAKRASHVMAYDSWRGVSVMHGGEFAPLTGGITYFGDTWEWNGAVWSLRQESSPSGKRSRSRMVFDSRRGVMVLWGGLTSTYQSDMWEWDGLEWTEVPQGPVVPDARLWHAMAYDSDRGVIVLFGGRDALNIFSDTWEYTPCLSDCERDCDLDLFDYLCFQDCFVNQSPYADFERDGDLDIFDFLEFQNQYVKGCG